MKNLTEKIKNARDSLQSLYNYIMLDEEYMDEQEKKNVAEDAKSVIEILDCAEAAMLLLDKFNAQGARASLGRGIFNKNDCHILFDIAGEYGEFEKITPEQYEKLKNIMEEAE